MVRAWYMDDSTEDQRLEHIRQPPEFVDLEKLKTLTGVLYWKVRKAMRAYFSSKNRTREF